MKCFVSAQDVADMVFFLAGDGGKRISGQAIAVDGHTETLGDGGGVVLPRRSELEEETSTTTSKIASTSLR